MQAKPNISVALMKGETHSVIADALLSYGLENVPDCSLQGVEARDLLLYSDQVNGVSDSVGDWIWLNQRATLGWIHTHLQRGVRVILGKVESESLSREILEGLSGENWHVQFSLGALEFDIDSAANILSLILELADYNSEREQKKLRVVALEAITNAWEHGYGKDKSKRIDVTYEVSAQGMKLCVEHQGLGFNLEDVPDPMAPENLLSESGRGIFIMNNTLDHLDYEKGGCRLIGYKNFDTN